VGTVRPAFEEERPRMPHPLFHRLGAAGRAGLLFLVMLALLLQTYALYIASALVPHQPWRRRLNFHLRRVMFAMDSMHVRGQE
jgi:hypothetical protein